MQPTKMKFSSESSTNEYKILAVNNPVSSFGK
jgi:hypothetical protein